MFQKNYPPISTRFSYKTIPICETNVCNPLPVSYAEVMHLLKKHATVGMSLPSASSPLDAWAPIFSSKGTEKMMNYVC